MWHELWLNSRPLIKYFGPNLISVADSSKLAEVGSIMNDGERVPHSSNHFLAVEMRHLVNKTHIYSRDSMVWDNAEHGKVTILIICT